jgi:glycine/D-amino acid oxidase-like deaminating enzyme
MPGQDGFDVSAYIVPRGENAAIVGVTYEVEFVSRGNDVKGLSAFLNGIRLMLPVAKNWEVAELKSGIRPVSQDMGPLVGWKAKNSRILVSIGHYGLGVTLAPFSANIIANAVGLTSKSPEGASAFAPSRLK